MTPSSEASAPPRWWPYAAAGLVCALTLALFNRIVFLGEWLSDRDMLRVYYPLAKYWADRVSAGSFPEWYPYDSLGQPFVAMSVSAAFHPLRLLNLVLPVDRATSGQTLLCYPLAALGAFGCARRVGAGAAGSVFAAVSYAFCGYLVAISNNLDYLMAAATFPLTLWAADLLNHRPSLGRAIALAASLCLLVFCGDAQTVLVAGAGIVVITALSTSKVSVDRRLAFVALGIVAGAMLAAPQLVPSFLTVRGARADINPLEIAEKFSLHPLRLVELALGPVHVSRSDGLLPRDLRAFMDPQMNSDWVSSVALGPMVLVLAAGAAMLRLRPVARACFAATAVLLLLLLVGRHLPFYGLAYRFVPLWRHLRYPEKLTPLLAFVLCVAAGLAASRALEDGALRRRFGGALLLASACLGALALCEAQLHLFGGVLQSQVGATEKSAAALSSAFVPAVAGAGAFTLLAAAALLGMRPRWAGAMLPALQGAWLVWAHLGVPQTVGLPLLSEPIGFTEALVANGASAADGPRVFCAASSYIESRVKGFDPRELVALGVLSMVSPDTGALFGFATPFYYLPAGSARVAHAMQHGGLFVRSLAGLYGARYVTAETRSRSFIEGLPGLRIIDELPDFGILLAENTRAAPRAYLATPVCAPDEEGAFARMGSEDFEPGRQAVLECGSAPPDPLPLPTAPLGDVAIRDYQPERVVIAAEPRVDGALLVLNDAWYQGWRATVDGREAQIELANAAVRGVRLKRGPHEIVFTFREPGLRAGAAIAILTAVVLSALRALQAALARARQKARPGAPG